MLAKFGMLGLVRSGRPPHQVTWEREKATWKKSLDALLMQEYQICSGYSVLTQNYWKGQLE